LLRDQTVIPKPSALLAITVREPDDAWMRLRSEGGG